MAYKYGVDSLYMNKSKGLNILIVDDDEMSSELFKEYLSLRGHNVLSLNEGIKCISQCMKNKYDIIFLDYHIGDIDGVELADCLKDVLKTESKIYAYTGDNSPTAIKKFKEIGMNGVLIKPLNLKKINNIIIDIENENITNKKVSSDVIFF
jgi:CheY-like chemotaxis protein